MFYDDVIQICNTFRADDLYVSPGIPNDKLCALSFTTMMPPNTQVFALIDTTVFGSAKNGMLITANGLYYHNDSTANMPGCFFLSWDDLWRTNNSMFPFKVELGELALTPMLHFEFSGCSLNADQIIPLLMNLRSAYGKYVGIQKTPAIVQDPPQVKKQTKCQFCDSVIDSALSTCPSCGASVSQQTSGTVAVPAEPSMQQPPVPQTQNSISPQPFPSSNIFQPSCKSRSTYVLLAFFFGCLGIHNFYIGRIGEGVLQLFLTILTMGLGCIVTVPWALINIFTVKTDSKGNILT